MRTDTVLAGLGRVADAVLAELASAFDAVLSAVTLPAPPPDVGDATERAREILERAEYQPRTRHPVERAVDWLLDRLGDAFSTASSGGNRIIGFLVVVGGVVLIARILSKLRFPLPASEGDDDEPVVDVIADRAAATWADEADEHERRGEWTDAVRARYRWTLARVLEDGHLDDVPGRTSGEYRRLLVALLPDVADAVDALTDVFESAWYGHMATTGADAVDARAWAIAIAEASARRPLSRGDELRADAVDTDAVGTDA